MGNQNHLISNVLLFRFKVENYGKDLLEKINKVEKVVIKDMEVKITLLEVIRKIYIAKGPLNLSDSYAIFQLQTFKYSRLM